MSDAGEERQSSAARRRRRRRRGASATGRAPQAQSQSQAQGSARPGTRNATRSAPPADGGAPSQRARRARGAPVSSAANARAARPARPAARAASPAALPPSSAPSAADARLTAHELADAQNEERRHANLRRLRLLVLLASALPAVVLGVIVGAAAGVVAGAVVAAAVCAALATASSTGSMWFALRLVGGTEVAHGALPALVNQVEGLSATIGVAPPDLRLVDDPVANACTLAGRRGHAVLVVTSGLLQRLGLIEMEGVVAHELVHLKRRDALVSSVGISTAGVLAWLTGRDRLVHVAIGRGREYGADQAAALAVRYPPGLRDALASMGGRPSGDGSPFTGRRWAATRWIWIDPMVGAVDRAPVGELDSIAVRVDALAEW
jgi:heat shock protein HtpX